MRAPLILALSASILAAGFGAQAARGPDAKAFADAVAKAKPTGAKGTYIQRIAVTSTMGPGVKVEPNTVLTA